MISDTLQIFCHHDQIHDPAAPLPFIDRDIIYHLFPDIVKEAIHFIIFQHDLARKLQIFLVDCVIVISSCFVFDIQTGLFSLTGLLAKSLVIDNVIESINRCKVFLIVCDNPDPICEFIYQDLKRSATVYKAHGAFTHNQKMIIMSVMKRGQAVQLRNFVKRYQPGAFIAIVNSSEIIGKGFRGLN